LLPFNASTACLQICELARRQQSLSSHRFGSTPEQPGTIARQEENDCSTSSFTPIFFRIDIRFWPTLSASANAVKKNESKRLPLLERKNLAQIWRRTASTSDRRCELPTF
jgi:hypothetical protein